MLLKLPDELRAELKKPLGELIETIPEKSMEKIINIIGKLKPRKIISIGDVITQYVLMSGALPDLSIIDHKMYRRKTEFSFNYDQFFNIIVHTTNPPGHISEEAWSKIRKHIKSKFKTLIIVDGEEDLLTLPALLEAPEGTLVLYGQPNVGVVFILVTDKAKEKARKIVEKFSKLENV